MYIYKSLSFPPRHIGRPYFSASLTTKGSHVTAVFWPGDICHCEAYPIKNFSIMIFYTVSLSGENSEGSEEERSGRYLTMVTILDSEMSRKELRGY